MDQTCTTDVQVTIDDVWFVNLLLRYVNNKKYWGAYVLWHLATISLSWAIHLITLTPTLKYSNFYISEKFWVSF